jgi:hypothetical protein
MKMFTFAANDMRTINQFVNDHGIEQSHIVNIFPSPDGAYLLVYFAEE